MQIGGGHAEPRRRTGREVLDEHVRAIQQPRHDH